jgi:hypothetical protein
MKRVNGGIELPPYSAVRFTGGMNTPITGSIFLSEVR